MTTVLSPQDRQDASELLFKVRVFLRQGWTQFARARDIYGEPVSPRDEAAVCWSLDGALCAADDTDSPSRFSRPAYLVEGAIERAAGPIDAMEAFNDKALSIYEVLAVIDGAEKFLKGGAA